jgi:hypothetical protein
MRSALVLFQALLALPCTSALAQAPELARGSRVQVTSPSHAANRLVGTVLSTNGDTLVLAVAGITESIRLPWSGLTEVQVSRGQRRHVGEGMLMGGAIGVGLGVLLGLASGDDDPGILALSAGDKAAIGGVLFGVVGLGIGGLIGARSTRERWEQVALGSVATRIGVAPRGDGLALVASARF